LVPTGLAEGLSLGGALAAGGVLPAGGAPPDEGVLLADGAAPPDGRAGSGDFPAHAHASKTTATTGACIGHLSIKARCARGPARQRPKPPDSTPAGSVS
jgi:hypothetical protein